MAYAAVVSLKQTIKFLLNYSQSRNLLPKRDLEVILEDVCYLQSFLKTINHMASTKSSDALERQIKDSAHKFEDFIESHASDPDGSGNESLTLIFSQELLKVKQQISSGDNREGEPRSSSVAVSGGKNKAVVGLVDELLQLLCWLVLKRSTLDVVSIVGMAGIGKTTIAKEVYYDSFVSDYFQIRLFVSVGPNYQLREVLLLFLDQLGFPKHEMHLKEDRKLGEFLHTCLKQRMYLVVLDDVWNTKVWDELQRFFPKIYGSRIIVTTRLVDVAPRIRKHKVLLQMPFLDDDQSWKLLHDIVFTNEEWCDPQLEKIGREIAKKCEGLPLAIIAVGNELLKIEKTVENWTKAEEDENLLLITTNDDTPISKSLTLSYKELPQHLKPCFLFMGVFPHKYEIPMSRLVKLWVVEGFLEPERSKKSLEETAEEFLDNLVSKSLVLVCERSSSGRIKSCKIHYVFRILCVSEALDEKFFHVMKKANSFPQGTNRQRCLCVHNNVVLSIKQVLSSMESVSAMRSLLCFGPRTRYPLPVCLQFRLLRVLDAFAIRFYKFPIEVLELVQLKYLAITYDGDHPESISKLWKLEVLIVGRYRSIKYSNSPVYLPIGIWSLKRLKHLECAGFDLPDPTANGDGENSVFLEKLLTLSGVTFHSCKPKALARMPNLMKLGVRIESKNDEIKTFLHFGNLTNLHHLESFKCVVVYPLVGSQVVSFFPTLPDNLRKITLSGCGYSWEYIAYIGRLPNLEVLKLRCYAFCGPEWVTIEGDFCKLKFLLLEDLDIEQWEVDSDKHFPMLASLIVRHCYKLKKIPYGIGGRKKA